MIEKYKEFHITEEQNIPVATPPELRDITKMIETVSAVPTATPRNVYEQIKIVVSGGNASLYFYDVTNNYWRATTLGT